MLAARCSLLHLAFAFPTSQVFTRWSNAYLRQRKLKIDDIYEDLKARTTNAVTTALDLYDRGRDAIHHTHRRLCSR